MEECKMNIDRIMFATGMNRETAYSMLLMTAALMDLTPSDEEAADMVIKDCTAEVRA